MAKARKAYRPAITGKYISKAAAKRHPRTSVSEARGTRNKGQQGVRHRSAITGRYVTAKTAGKNPKTTVTENG